MNAKPALTLNAAERAHLTELSLRRKTSQALALRARIVLACALGRAHSAIAREERVSVQTVAKWRARFLAGRIDGLTDAPRSGAPRTVDEARVRSVIATTLHAVPSDAPRWTTRSMARACGLSQSAISRIWREHGLQPHRGQAVKGRQTKDNELPTQSKPSPR
jgi:transposase